MSEAQEIAEHYFKLSNKSDFKGIAKLFTDSTVYVSQNTGKFIGKDEIIKMQKTFHGNFSLLHWAVESIKEISPGVYRFEFLFNATELDGKVINSAGQEDVAIKNGKIASIVIKNK